MSVKSAIQTLQGYFSNGIAKNAAALGGQVAALYALKTDVSAAMTAAGVGNVVGQGTSTAGHVPVYNDTAGKIIKDAGFAVDAAGTAQTKANAAQAAAIAAAATDATTKANAAQAAAIAAAATDATTKANAAQAAAIAAAATDAATKANAAQSAAISAAATDAATKANAAQSAAISAAATDATNKVNDTFPNWLNTPDSISINTAYTKTKNGFLHIIVANSYMGLLEVQVRKPDYAWKTIAIVGDDINSNTKVWTLIIPIKAAIPFVVLATPIGSTVQSVSATAASFLPAAVTYPGAEALIIGFYPEG